MIYNAVLEFLDVKCYQCNLYTPNYRVIIIAMSFLLMFVCFFYHSVALHSYIDRVAEFMSSEVFHNIVSTIQNDIIIIFKINKFLCSPFLFLVGLVTPHNNFIM